MQIPIPTLHLFPKLDAKLLELLKSLSPEDWNKPTLARQWTVKDIASHLLDGNIRTLSISRDKYIGERPESINSYQDLVDFLNRLNADWVRATRRVSPAVLIELLEITGKEFTEQLNKLDPFAPAIFSVAWAGQAESPNWFHIAREYTEKWHHQQQIREAVMKPGIMTQEFFFPLIDIFMQALPHTYRNVQAEEGTSVIVRVTSEMGGEWILLRSGKNWLLQKGQTRNHQIEIVLDPDIAWKLFTKGMNGAEAEKKIKFSGDLELGKPILSMLSVMA
ncbi:MAG TPA: maleylpyruvate isomerase N-terminal domain-containing protein [Cyclobacteriaceae bacterium]|nr:maleylpyruvate isomerase N-terminal domain-containing protein [Cyclobacteriaceae bacterium]